jgi:hypothetical protein
MLEPNSETAQRLWAKSLSWLGSIQAQAKGSVHSITKNSARQDPPGAAFVEVDDAEAPLFELADEDRRDQVTGDDEKHIDPDETTAERRGTGVEQDDGRRRPCAGRQSLDDISMD